MTTEQDRYLTSLLDKSEEDLLFEIARHTMAPIMASSGTRSHGGPTRIPPGQLPPRARLNQVPSSPVTEAAKPALTSFLKIAQMKVDAMHSRVYHALCDSASGKPNEQAIDVTTGQVKDIIAAAAGLLLSKYSTELSIGIPVAVYYLKKGLLNFCATKP